MRKTTAILCRTNAPLVRCAFDLIREGRGIKVKIIGRDIAADLKQTIGEVLGYRRNCDRVDFLILLDDWINRILDDFGSDESKEAFVSECEDKFGCLKCIAMQCDDVNEVHKTIDNYFVDIDDLTDDPDTIVLASGHRSKGLEWDRVIWLRPELCPHPAAESEADKKQEEHLKYIIATRAKEELLICAEGQPE